MGNNKSYKFVDLEITSAKLPFNTHLIVEASDGDLYMVDSTNQDVLLKSDNKGSTWSTIATRDNEIRALWYDRTNEYIYLLDCDNTNLDNEIDIAYIDLSDDSVNDLGTFDVADATLRAYDIFIIGATVYVLIHQEGPAINNKNIYSVDDPGFTLIDSVLSDAPDFSTYMAIASSVAYHIIKTSGLAGIHILDFDTPNYGSLHSTGAGFTLCDDANLRGIAYDGTDTLYFVLKDTDDDKNYLCTYGITGDTFTQLSEYNVALMLDRNCSNTVPNEYEKGFDIAKDANNLSRIWEIKPRKGGLIQLQTINKNANIIAITDNFVMFGGGEMEEDTDILATNTIAEGKVNKGIFPIPTKGRFNCHPQDAHFFSNDDSLKVYDDTDELALFAKIIDKSRDQDGIYVFGLDAYTNELYRRSYIKSHNANKSSDKVKDNIDNACDFCHRDSSIDSSDATNYSYEQDRPPMAMLSLDRFMERKVGYAEPNGKVWTKAYDGLAKAPQYYKGTYNFRDEAVGTDHDDIDGISHSASVDTVEIVASYLEHKKPLYFKDADGGAFRLYFASGQVTGTYEVYLNNAMAQDYYFRAFNESSGNIINIRYMSKTNIRIYSGDGVGGDNETNVTVVEDAWVRIRVYFSCTTDKYSVWIDGVLKLDDQNFTSDAVATTMDWLQIYSADAFEGYLDALGFSWDANYNIGDNVVAWDVERNGKLDLININRDKPSLYVKKLGITRATCVGAAGISQTYNDASLEDGKTILPLKEYRDMKIQANAEALQIATALFNMFSKETDFIGLKVVNQEFIQAGKTVNFANTGDITVTEADLLVLFYTYDFINDVYDLMILTNNVVLLREFESYFDRSELLVNQNSTAVRENATDIDAITSYHHRAAALIGWDFAIGAGLTADSSYRDLDISAIVPSTTIAVDISAQIKDGVAGTRCWFGHPDYDDYLYRSGMRISTINTSLHFFVRVPVKNQSIRYYITTGMDDCNINLVGWES